MQFSIKVIDVNNTHVPNAKGGYNKLEVAYKNLESGKVESKILMSFGLTKDSYKALADAKNGDNFTIESEKKPGNDGKEYWTWMAASQLAPGEQMVQAKAPAGNPAPKSNYETPEERAKKQIYIIKQSSLSNAVAVLGVGAKTPPKTEDIFALAQTFTDWVVSQEVVKLQDMPDDFPDVQ